MQLREKINFKKYISLSIVLIAIFYPFLKNSTEFKVLIITYVAVLINQYMLLLGVADLIGPMTRGKKADGGWILFLFIGKALMLIIALIYGVQIMGNRIIIPVLFYVCQIFVLIFSSKRRIESK